MQRIQGEKDTPTGSAKAAVLPAESACRSNWAVKIIGPGISHEHLGGSTSAGLLGFLTVGLGLITRIACRLLFTVYIVSSNTICSGLQPFLLLLQPQPNNKYTAAIDGAFYSIPSPLKKSIVFWMNLFSRFIPKPAFLFETK